MRSEIVSNLNPNFGKHKKNNILEHLNPQFGGKKTTQHIVKHSDQAFLVKSLMTILCLIFILTLLIMITFSPKYYLKGASDDELFANKISSSSSKESFRNITLDDKYQISKEALLYYAVYPEAPTQFLKKRLNYLKMEVIDKGGDNFILKIHDNSDWIRHKTVYINKKNISYYNNRYELTVNSANYTKTKNQFKTILIMVVIIFSILIISIRVKVKTSAT